MDRTGRVNVIEGDLSAAGRSFGIVVARFNGFIVERLLEGSLEGIERHGGDLGAVDIAWVPGSHEIPFAAKKMALSERYDAVICLGCVIRGATAHFDYVAGGAASGVMSTSLETNAPVIFGVLTTETIEQAIERAGTKRGNLGFESAVAAVEMASLATKLGASRTKETESALSDSLTARTP